MTIVNDEAVFNVAGTQANWTAQDFDPPVDNNSSSAVQINREGTACQEWVLKENITTGYTFTSTLGGTKNISNGEVVVFWFFVTSDADFDKLSLFRLRLSSDTAFTTNYAEWDGKAQIEGLDLYGWFPVTVYPANPDATAGTIVYSSIDSIGWVATTGGTGTKLTGFDQCHSISYIGGHSQTVTLANLQSENDTNDLGVMFSFGDFSKIRVNIRIGGGTTTNAVFNETNKTLFFDNVEPEHELGFIGVDNTTGTNTLDLDGWAIFWNQQTSTTAEVVTDPQHLDIFRIHNGSLARGGKLTARTYISDADTFIKDQSLVNLQQIDPRNLPFERCSIIDSAVTATDDGAVLLDAEGTARWLDLSFTRGSSSHAIVITATGTYTFTGFTYSGYGADASNTAVIRNESGGAVTINVTGGDTPTFQNGASATTTVNVSVPVSFEVVDKDDAAIQSVRITAYLISDDTEVINTTSNASGLATTTFAGTTPADIYYRYRKSSTGATKYVNLSGFATIASTTGVSVKRSMTVDDTADPTI